MHAFLFYQYNENLLIQFILHEAFNTYKHLKKTPQPAYSKIARLDARMCPFNPLGSVGTLQKMEHYCKLIHTFSHLETSSLLELVEQSILSAVDEKEEAFKKYFSDISTFLYSFLIDFKNEETVLFYLLRNQKNLDLLFGKRSTSTFFKHHVDISVFQRYLDRGFQEIIPLIEQYLKELEI